VLAFLLARRALKVIFAFIARRILVQRPLRYTIETVKGTASQRSAFAALGIPTVSADFLKTRGSDTLFILGSAPNINDFENYHFDVIRQNDSMGFNSWSRHTFVPTHYLAQAPLAESVIERLTSHEYAATCLLLRGDKIAREGPLARGVQDLLRRHASPTKMVSYLAEFPINHEIAVEADDVLDFLKALGLWSFGEIAHFVPKFRTTVGLATALGYAMGYRTIVVCGSDSRSLGHFWDDRQTARGRLDSARAYFRSDLWMHESRLLASNTQSDYFAAIDRDLRANHDGGVFWGALSGNAFGLRDYWSVC